MHENSVIYLQIEAIGERNWQLLCIAILLKIMFKKITPVVLSRKFMLKIKSFGQGIGVDLIKSFFSNRVQRKVMRSWHSPITS